MKTFFTPLNTILLLGAAQGFTLAVILTFKKKGNQNANRILAGILFFLSFAIIFHSLSHALILPFLKTHALIIGVASVLIGPLLYLYVKALTSFEFKMSRTDLFHFLPFFLCGVVVFLHLFFGVDPNGRLIRTLINAISFSLFGFYLILANFRLISYSRTIKDNFSDIKKINLYWLRIFIFLLTQFLIFIAIFDLFFQTKSWDLIWLVSCIIIYIICYVGLIQPVIFSGPVLESGVGLVKTKKKYQKSSLSGKMADQYRNQLQSQMNEKKWFLDQNISLSDLAEKMGVSIHHLSQVINEKLGLNFYDFINSLRIAEAKKRLTDPRYRHLSIASIGFEVGFNSLSAFNGAFKKFTNLTPSQYKDQ